MTTQNTPATNTDRAAIIARIRKTVGIVSKGSASLLDDTLSLCQGIPSADFAAVLTPEIGGFRIGRVLKRADSATLVKALRDSARDGGAVKLVDVASVLGISTGQVSTLNSMTLDADGGEIVDAGTGDAKSEKSAEDVLERILADVKKALKRDDIRSEDAQYLLSKIAREVRSALPSGIDTNNRGGQA